MKKATEHERDTPLSLAATGMEGTRVTAPEPMIWPTFYIVGAARCGTTSVWAHLKKHPHVFLPDMKEPSYFISAPAPSEIAAQYCTGDSDAYQALYRGAKGYQAIGDVSPGYLWDRQVPLRIHDHCPRARILILLRDPVDRAYSHYLMLARMGLDSLPFDEAVRRDNSQDPDNWWYRYRYIETGLYFAQVARYFEAFGRDQVAVFLFEDFAKDPAGMLTSAARHIGVDPELLNLEELGRVYNPTRTPRFKWLYDGARQVLSLRARSLFPEALRAWLSYNPLFYRREKPAYEEKTAKYLQSIFEPDICRLEELLGAKLPQLRATWM
jgi:hypothetical protein